MAPRSIPQSTTNILSSFLLFLTPSLVSATCYWQNSTLAPTDPYSIATDDTACFPSQENSPCCGTGWSCLSDGVCYIEISGSGFYYRGTCTDRTWDSQQCPGWCFAQNSNTSIPLLKCTKSTGEDWYCCPGDPNCNCDTGKNAVKLGASEPSTVTVIGSTSWPGFTSNTTPFTADPLVTAGTSTDAAATDLTATGDAPAGTPTQTPGQTTNSDTAAAASATPTPSSNSTSNSSSGSSTALAAGLGAGLGAAAILIGGLVLFLIRAARRRRDLTKSNEVKNFNASGNSTFSEVAGYSEMHAPNIGVGGVTYHDNVHKIAQGAAGQGYHDSTRTGYVSSELPVQTERLRAEMDGQSNENMNMNPGSRPGWGGGGRAELGP